MFEVWLYTPYSHKNTNRTKNLRESIQQEVVHHFQMLVAEIRNAMKKNVIFDFRCLQSFFQVGKQAEPSIRPASRKIYERRKISCLKRISLVKSWAQSEVPTTNQNRLMPWTSIRHQHRILSSYRASRCIAMARMSAVDERCLRPFRCHRSNQAHHNQHYIIAEVLFFSRVNVTPVCRILIDTSVRKKCPDSCMHI